MDTPGNLLLLLIYLLALGRAYIFKVFFLRYNNFTILYNDVKEKDGTIIEQYD